MNTLTAISELLSAKDEALTKALEWLIRFREPCTEKTCDESYHWRGCPTIIDPILEEIKEAIKLR